VTIPENLDAIHSMILDDGRMSTKKVDIPRKSRLYYSLDMRKLSAEWIHKCLNADQKHDCLLASQVIVDRFWQDPVGFLNCLVTMDES
jgi:hypothetical protein